jgi:hypothetical protein
MNVCQFSIPSYFRFRRLGGVVRALILVRAESRLISKLWKCRQHPANVKSETVNGDAILLERHPDHHRVSRLSLLPVPNTFGSNYTSSKSVAITSGYSGNHKVAGLILPGVCAAPTGEITCVQKQAS